MKRPVSYRLTGQFQTDKRVSEVDYMSATNGTPSRQLKFALDYRRLGFSQIPVRTDGSKAPAIGAWANFQNEAADETLLQKWFATPDRNGIAGIGGKVSGNLCVIDFEIVELFERWAAKAHVILGDAWDNLPIVETPRPGRHVYLRLDHPPQGSDKLAMRRATPEELAAKPMEKFKTIIETKSEGGYVLMPGSPGRCHATGNEYRFLQYGWIAGQSAQLINDVTCAKLLDFAREFDERPTHDDRKQKDEPRTTWTAAPETASTTHSERPGDDFNRRGPSIQAQLQAAGWKHVGNNDHGELWRRPGKDENHSACIQQDNDRQRLYVFSSSTEFEVTSASRPRGYDAFEVFAVLHHHGDCSAAAKALNAGYGRRHDQGSDQQQHAESHHGGGNQVDNREGRQAPVWSPSPIESTTFANGDYRHDWQVKKLLVTKEPAIIFGPSKAMKTSTLVDLAVSLATGTPALGYFDVPHSRRVLIISGESGPASLQSIARRVCESKGTDFAGIGDDLEWEFSVPPLSSQEAVVILRQLLSKHRREIVAIDPAYLALLSGGNASADKAANLFHMGPLLGGLVDACNAAGSQLFLAHHCNTRIAIGDEPDLSHLAYSGFQQFARQWIGVNRMTAYTHDGKHKLIVVAGGSAGHGGKWVCSIDEGELADDFTGRRWDVQVELFTEAKEREKEEKADAKETARETKFNADLLAMFNAVKDLAASASEAVATKNKLRAKLGWNSDKVSTLLERLVMDGKIVPKEATVASGVDGKSPKLVNGFAVAKTDDLFN